MIYLWTPIACRKKKKVKKKKVICQSTFGHHGSNPGISPSSFLFFLENLEYMYVCMFGGDGGVDIECMSCIRPVILCEKRLCLFIDR